MTKYVALLAICVLQFKKTTQFDTFYYHKFLFPEANRVINLRETKISLLQQENINPKRKHE